MARHYYVINTISSSDDCAGNVRTRHIKPGTALASIVRDTWQMKKTREECNETLVPMAIVYSDLFFRIGDGIHPTECTFVDPQQIQVSTTLIKMCYPPLARDTWRVTREDGN